MMSWVRVGQHSNVYVYHDVGGFLCCCGCRLVPHKGPGASTNLKRYSLMFEHLRAHRQNGDRVPKYAFEEGRKELREYGEIVATDPANVIGGYFAASHWPFLFRLHGVKDPHTGRLVTGRCSMCADRGVVHRSRREKVYRHRFHHLCACPPEQALVGRRVRANGGGTHIACPRHHLLVPPNMSLEEWLRNRGD